MNELTLLRKPKGPVTKQALYGYQPVAISRDLHTELKRIKQETGIPMSELVTLAVERFIQQVKISD